MQRNIGQIARVVGVSVRTLHYYDEIGLLKPAEVTQSGYRLYDDESLSRLQQILFYRALGFPLSDIAEILASPNYDKTQALRNRRELLLAKRRDIDNLIRLVDMTLEEQNMENGEIRADYSESVREAYAKEAEERWGHTAAYAESARKQADRTDKQRSAIQQEAEDIFSAFAACRHCPPDALQTQKLVQRWQEHITAHHYVCSREILAGLGEMYTEDERFTADIDRFGEGTARLMRDAIRIYCAE